MPDKITTSAKRPVTKRNQLSSNTTVTTVDLFNKETP